jgi:hypothetical protein
MARRLLYTLFIRSDRFAGSRISGKEIVMQPIITITVDEKGNAKIDDLPHGVFYSRFAPPPGAETMDVISINAAGDYVIELRSDLPMGKPVYSGPVKPLKEEPFLVSFSVDGTNLPPWQEYGTAGCAVGGIKYTLGVIVNPAVVVIPATIDKKGAILVKDDYLPVGVQFDPFYNEFHVWAAGGYTFAFSLLPADDWQFVALRFTRMAPTVTSEIGADGLTAWVYNNYLATSRATKASFDFEVSDALNGIQKIIDPTIINNPINQGGSGGVPALPKSLAEPRHELAGVLVG